MSDYLTNLAAKTLGFAPTIVPRLPSLHEPPILAGVQGPEEVADVSLPPTSWPVRSMVQSDEGTNLHVPIHESLASVATVTPPSALLPITPSPGPVMQHSDFAEGPLRSNATQTEAESVALSESADRSHPLQASPRADRQTQTFAANRFAAAFTTAVTPLPTDASISISYTLPEQETSLPKPNTDPPLISALAEQKSANKTEPTIEVTIGRIDVRAIMPEVPPARPKPARSAPRLSLEEYLRKGR